MLTVDTEKFGSHEKPAPGVNAPNTVESPVPAPAELGLFPHSIPFAESYQRISL